MANNKLILRNITSPYTFPYPDIVKGSVLSWSDVDNNFTFLKGLSIENGSYDSGNSTITLNRINGSAINISGITGGGTANSYVASGIYTGDTIVFTYTSGGTFSVTGITSGGTDVFVTGGTYTGDTIIFTNNSGDTFSVTGITSGGTTNPAGSDTFIQFNDNGSFGGNSGLTYDNITQQFVSTSVINSNVATITNGIIPIGLQSLSGVGLTYDVSSSNTTDVIAVGNVSNQGGVLIGHFDGMKSNNLIASPDSIEITSTDTVGGLGYANLILTPTGTTLTHSYSGVSDFVISNSFNNLFKVDNSGIVTFANTFTFPNLDGANGQALITDGFGNVTWSTVSGGTSIMVVGSGSGSTKRDNVSNIASGTYSSSLGGFNNSATNSFTTIGGGRDNTVSGACATIGGGYNNTVGGVRSTVSGGEQNITSGGVSTVGGGGTNCAIGNYSVIAGGRYNSGSGNYSIIAGGRQNTITTNYATIGGGSGNTSSGVYTSILGGIGNVALGDISFIGGGGGNTASGNYSTVSGGYCNVASNTCATVAGGSNNTASGYMSSVLGGSGNTASGTYSSVLGGCNNTATGNYSSVLGGFGLSAAGNTSAVPNLDINGDLTFIGTTTALTATIGLGGAIPASAATYITITVNGTGYKMPLFNT